MSVTAKGLPYFQKTEFPEGKETRIEIRGPVTLSFPDPYKARSLEDWEVTIHCLEEAAKEVQRALEQAYRRNRDAKVKSLEAELADLEWW